MNFYLFRMSYLELNELVSLTPFMLLKSKIYFHHFNKRHCKCAPPFLRNPILTFTLCSAQQTKDGNWLQQGKLVSPCSEFRIMKQTNKHRSVRYPHAFSLQIILSIHNEAVTRGIMTDNSPARHFTALERMPGSKAAAAMLSAMMGRNGPAP